MKKFIPALGYSELTRFYDPVVALTVREKEFKPQLIRSATIKDGNRVLDLGCGTGTLTIATQQAYPNASVTGLDADPSILKIAKAKAFREGISIQFDQGFSTQLPYEDGSFDRVLSSLMFHHLNREDKLRSFREVHRVLKPGAGFHIADWGKSSGVVMRFAYLGIQLLDGFETTEDNVQGMLPKYLQDSGFSDVETTAQYSTVFGTLALYQAKKPAN